MRKIFYTIAIFMAGLGLASPVFALTISPAKFEITGNPGQALAGEIDLYNEQQEGSKTFFSSFENFEPKGDSGAPYFTGAKGGLATWMHTNEKITLESGARIKVPFSITIPKDAEPGGHFAAIFFGSQAHGVTGGEVSIGGKIGMLVLLRVSGYVPEGGGLVEFTSKTKHRFFSSLPVTLMYRFNNTGGDRVVPSGEIKIKNTFRTASAALPANKNEGSVLPSSTRKFEVTWGSVPQDEKTGFLTMAAKEWNDFHFGWYTAEANLSWGLTNQKASGTYNFFIIPWQLLLIVLCLFGVGLTGLKKYNRFIIGRAAKK